MKQKDVIRVIHNDADYSRALQNVEAIWDAAIPGTPDGDRLELLTLVVEEYEKKHFVIEADYDPIDVIKFWMEQKGLARKDLEPIIGHRGRIAEILNRRRPLSIEMIRGLNKAGIPAQMLVGEIRLKKSRKSLPAKKRLTKPAKPQHAHA